MRECEGLSREREGEGQGLGLPCLLCSTLLKSFKVCACARANVRKGYTWRSEVNNEHPLSTEPLPNSHDFIINEHSYTHKKPIRSEAVHGSRALPVPAKRFLAHKMSISCLLFYTSPLSLSVSLSVYTCVVCVEMFICIFMSLYVSPCTDLQTGMCIF